MATPHRDGFFRGLQDIGSDDAIEFEKRFAGRRCTASTEHRSSTPEDVSVLEPRSARSLTLVTCYPFCHVGPAPQPYMREGQPAQISEFGENDRLT
jgi:sortase A